ncbi:ArnT family glycosyltransferase, partial [Patescibacteria group bacterium]
LLITGIGGFFRFYNLNWDQGHLFHPDERNLASAVTKISFFNQLNPEFFAYGSLPIYLYRLIGELLVLITHNHSWISDWGQINLIGRGVSATVSTASIGLVYYLSRKLFNKKIALFSALLMATFPSLIQVAHFGVTESLITFWTILLAILSLKLFEKPSFFRYTLTGIFLGLSVATKISTLSLLSFLGLAHFLNYPQLKKPSVNFLKQIVKHSIKFLLLTFSAFTTFLALSPFVFLSWPKFTESINYEGGVVSGRLKVVYVFQFEKTLPYLFQLKNLFWQIGPVALVAVLGFLWLCWLTLKNRNKKQLIFLIFPLCYFAYVGSWYTKFIRYMIPLLPFLAISASWLIYNFERRWKKVAQTLIVLTLVSSMFWALAFFSIYTRKSTRITASQWIYQNIPKQAKILTEHWDDGLPVSIPPHRASQFQTESLTIYDPDNPKKALYYSEKLAESDYLIFNSRRLYGTLMNWPERYPITSRYYHLLFQEKLGYRKVAQFTSYPSFLGLKIIDDRSEETFQVYDHPKVIIFKNIERLNQAEILNKINL